MIEKTENQIKIRVKSPDDFVENSFKTVDMGKGISQIMGKMMSDPDGKMQTQALRFDTESWTEDKAKTWAKEHGFMHDSEEKYEEDHEEEHEEEHEKEHEEKNMKKKMMPKKMPEKMSKENYSNLKNVEIFGCGMWNGKNFTEKELDEIVSSYNEIGNELQPFLKLGHSEEQLMHKKSNEIFEEGELPALGYISQLKRVGEKLLADISDVPKTICDLIKKKAYKRVSAELYRNFKSNTFDKKFPLVLRAIALLGGQTPEVTNLADVAALYSSDKLAEVFIYSMSNESKEIINKGEDKMDQELMDKFNKEKEIFEIQKKEFELKLSKLQPVLDVMADKVENTDQLVQFVKNTAVEIQKAKDAQAKAAEILEFAKKKEIDSYVNEMIGKKITPVQAEIARSILHTIDKFEESNPQVLTFSMKIDSIDLKEKMNLQTAFKSFIKAQPDLSLLETFASSKAIASGNINEERKTLVNELIEQDKSNLSKVNKFAKAQSKLLKIRPDLFE